MVSIDYHGFPHIVEAILSNVPRDVLPSLRGLSRSVRDFVDTQLARHVVLHPARLTLADVTALFDTPPPLFAAAVGTMFAVDLGEATATTTPTTVTLAAKYYTVAPVVRDNLQLAPVIKQRLARDEAALAHAQIVDLVGDVPPTYWSMIPRATTVRIFPAWKEDLVTNSAFLALEALRPDTAVLFTRPAPQDNLGRPPGQSLWYNEPHNYSAPRHLQFPRTRRLVVHVTPPGHAYIGLGSGRGGPLEVWTPPGRGGFQADEEIIYIFHEDWRGAWKYTYPPVYIWRQNGDCPRGRPHRRLPRWDGYMSFLTPLFVAMGEALEHIPRVTVVGLDEVPLRIMMLPSPYERKRLEVMRAMPLEVIKRACQVTDRRLCNWDEEWGSRYNGFVPSELMYRLMLSDIIKDPHATDRDMRDYLDAQVRAGASINTSDWQEQRQGDLQHGYDKFRQYLIDCMQCASLEQRRPDDPDQVLCFQPPEAWDRDRFEQLVSDKLSFLTHDVYRDMVGDEQWRVETMAHPWPPNDSLPLFRGTRIWTW